MTTCGYGCYVILFLISWIVLYISLRGKLKALESRGIVLGPLYLILNIRSAGAALERSFRGSRRASRLISISPAVAAALMIYALYFLSSNLWSYFAAPRAFSAVIPLVPFVTVRSPFLLAIFLAAIPILIIPHELSHALAAASRGIGIKGGGFLLVTFLMGAFVELDEGSFRNAKWRHRMVTAAAGPTANAVIAGVVLALLLTQPYSYLYLPSSVAAPFYHPEAGVLVAGVVPGSPAQAAGISTGTVLLSVNGTPLDDVGALGGLNVSAGELLVIDAMSGGHPHTYYVRAAEISGRAMIGVYAADYMRPDVQLPYLGASADYFMVWLLMISFAVAAFNMLPMAPFDGAVFMDAALSAAVRGDASRRAILYSLYALSALLLAGNIALSLMKFGVPSL